MRRASVDTGAELSWFPARVLESLGIARKKLWHFRQANGTELAPDPKSIPSAGELLMQLDLGVAPAAPNNDVTNPSGAARPAAVTPKPAIRQSDAPMCMQCGVQMNRAGSCHACPSCGSTSGCS